MFKGLGIAMAIVTAFLFALPAAFLYAAGGSEWFDQLRVMTPLL